MSFTPRPLGLKPGARRLFSGVCFLVLLLAGIPGCSDSKPRADIVIVNGQEPETLDPAIGTGVEDSRITSALFEGLTRNDPKTGSAIPGLAESWEISPDGKTYTFHLRTNLWWNENEPITAEDVVYSWRRLLDPKTGATFAGQLFYLKNGEDFNCGKITDPEQVGVHAIDARTLRVELNSPTAFFLDLCTCQALAVVPRKLIEKYGDRWIMSVHPLPSSGPFRFESWRLNDRLRIRKNPFYWDAVHTRSERIDFLPLGNPSTVLNLYERGEVDIVWDKDNLPAELIDILRKRPDFHTYDYLGTYFLRFNTTRAPFTDPKVRKALGMAIDRRRIVERILRTGERIATHLVPEGAAHYDPIAGMSYDPAQARRLLAEAGYPGGKGFPAFHYLLDSAGGGGKMNVKIAVEIQHMWQQELGIHTELRLMEKKVYLAAQNRLDYDVTRSSWLGDYNDPNTFLDVFRSTSGNNRTGWKNARYDELIQQANLETDEKNRTALLKAAETILIEEDPPIAPVYHYVGFNFFNPSRIEGIYQNFPDEHPLNYVARINRKR